jgi:hypothetical protein
MNRIRLICLFSAVAMAATRTVTVSPDTVMRGDTFKLTVLVSDSPCVTAYFDPKDPSKNIQISGSGIALTTDPPTVTNCSLVATMKVDPNAAFGERMITIYSSQDNKELLGKSLLTVASLTPGPIPPGIKPQVDVMWNVLSRPSCSDQFGVRIAQRFYCVEVVLGNNSGYALILSGIGFLHRVPGFDYRESNVSYLNVRSAAQREQVISGRNITLRSLQAAGIVIAGFAPFPVNAIPRLRLTQWSTVMGTVLSGAWDGLIPDRTLVQSHNLDDAALRDGKLVANNSPVRFTIFVARESIKGLLLPLPQRLAYQASLLKEWAAETRLTIGAGDADAALKEANATAMEKLAKTIAENIKAGEDRPDVAEAGSKPWIGRRKTHDEADLIQVRRALGSLILVGDQIDYIQRIRVDSSAVNPEIAARPFIDGGPIITPVLAADTISRTVTINGSNLSGAQVSITWQLTTETPVPLAPTPTPALSESDAIHAKFSFALTAAQAKTGATVIFTVTTNGGKATTSTKVP